MAAYLRATDRGDQAALAEAAPHASGGRSGGPRGPEEVLRRGGRDQPVRARAAHRGPALARPRAAGEPLAAEVKKEGWPAAIKAALIGSCTNSSYEDMQRAAHIATQALKAGLKAKTPFLVTPGLRAHLPDHQARRDHEHLRADRRHRARQRVRALHRPVEALGRRATNEVNTIVSSFNRNFPGRNDGSAATMSFLTSPEIVTALAFAGLAGVRSGQRNHSRGRTAVRSASPRRRARSCPRAASPRARRASRPPPPSGDRVEVQIPPDSERLQLLQPFPRWDGRDFTELPILVKTKGKTTTDHISPAGDLAPLPRPSRQDQRQHVPGRGERVHRRGGQGHQPHHRRERARPSPRSRATSRRAAISWIVIGDENYGEGSSREHAAMSPRYLGAKVVIVQELRAHPRDQPQEAGHPAPDLRGPQGLRPLRAGRTASP